MTLEQLKERIGRTLQKYNIDYVDEIILNIDQDSEIWVFVECINDHVISSEMPSCDLLLEAVDLECRAIKARQSSATNGIDEN